MVKNKLEKICLKIADDIVYGKDEDIFLRNARNIKFKKQYSNSLATAWLPGYFAYVNIRDGIKNQELTKKQKIGICVISLSLELVLDAVRFGSIYSLYKLDNYLQR